MSVVDEFPHLTDSSDDEFEIGASAQVPKKRRRRAPLGAAGSLACFFLLCNGALVAESDELHRLWATTVDTEPHFGADSSGVLGLVFCTWKFLQDDDDDEIGRSLQRQQVRSRRRATIHGYLRYVAQHVFCSMMASNTQFQNSWTNLASTPPFGVISSPTSLCLHQASKPFAHTMVASCQCRGLYCRVSIVRSWPREAPTWSRILRSHLVWQNRLSSRCFLPLLRFASMCARRWPVLLRRLRTIATACAVRRCTSFPRKGLRCERGDSARRSSTRTPSTYSSIFVSQDGCRTQASLPRCWKLHSTLQSQMTSSSTRCNARSRPSLGRMRRTRLDSSWMLLLCCWSSGSFATFIRLAQTRLCQRTCIRTPVL